MTDTAQACGNLERSLRRRLNTRIVMIRKALKLCHEMKLVEVAMIHMGSLGMCEEVLAMLDRKRGK